jgi:tyrosyl-tRNA synthetase
VGRILDINKIKVVFNSEWFEKMSISRFLGLTMQVTVSQILQREDFKTRMEQKQDVSVLEFMYPILQGYDSVFLHADIELGGTDQIFNLLVGRDLQKDFGQEPQVVLTMPLLEGTDGVNKMSKSLGNYIAINDKPGDMFGKIMSISDELMLKYYTLLTGEELGEIKKLHPKDAKVRLAKTVISQYYSEKIAESAAEEFQRVFSAKEKPQEMPVLKLSKEGKGVIEIITESGICQSKNEARRLIRQNAVEFNDSKVTDESFMIKTAGILKVGPRRFLKIT